MTCSRCENGKWRWGSGPCVHGSREACERVNARFDVENIRARNGRVKAFRAAVAITIAVWWLAS